MNLTWLPRDDTPLAAAAARYATHGWPIFPCRGKVPLTERGLHAATAEPGEVAAWWRAYPAGGIGWALPAGLVALDVDGAEGSATLRELERQHGPLPLTLRALTGGGGEHWIFTLPGTAVRNRAGIAPGLDVRALGGYVVVAPSVHASGRRYRWIAAVEPVPIPAWLLDLIAPPRPTPPAYTPPPVHDGPERTRRQRYAQAVLRRLAAEVAATGEGARNATLNRAWYRCGQLADALDKAEARAELLRAALAAGLDEREALRVLR